MVRHGTHGRSTAARPPHPLTHKKPAYRAPTCPPRPHPFPEKPPCLCPAPKNCRRRTFVAPQNPRRRAAPARGPRTVVYLHRPNRNAPQQARPLLVGRVCVAPEPKALAGGTAAHAGARPLLVGRAPSLATTAPSETHRSLPAPCSWGRQASPRSRRHWLAAPPPHPSPKNRRRRQAPARGPVAVSPLLCPNRNAPQPACPLRVGQTGVTPEPKALAAGTAGLTREGRSRYNRDSRMMWEVLPHVCSGRPGQSGP